MASIIVKVSDGTDIRRFTARSDVLTYLALKKRIIDLFDLASFKLQYTDDEGDQITMTSEEELQEAITQARKLEPSVLRLKLKKERGSSSPRSSSAERDANQSAARPPQPEPLFTSTPEVSECINHLTKQLPSLVQQLPVAVQRILPKVELDVSASLAATADAAAKAAAVAASRAADNVATTGVDAAGHAFDGQANTQCQGYHPGVSCDRSGKCPIVGIRYNLRGHDYDLCEAEYSKLSAEEKAEYVKILPSTFTCKPPAAKDFAKNSTQNDEFYGVHLGVTCDKSGESPIVGYRYHLPGYNYDLNQTEYDKLSSDEKSSFQRVKLLPNRRGDGFGFNGGGGFSPHFFGPGWSQNSHHRTHHIGGATFGGGGRACRAENKWAARFVCDLSIHDGTQMAASTKFTKIWRMKNVGEVAWPAGARLLHVAGDKMSATDSVLVSSSPVAPGTEIDIAVDMKAPGDLGRYMSYFRLVGPHGRRKFGQRVWCHIQVVDESSPALPHTTEMEATEMEKLLSMPRGEATDGEDAEEETDSSVCMKGMSAVAMEVDAQVDADAQTDKAIASDADAQTDKAMASDADAQTDKAMASDADAQTDKASNADADAQTDLASKADTDMQTEQAAKTDADAQTEHSGNTSANVVELEAVKTELTAMGFSDDDLLNAVLAKHGASLEECAQELASLSEWDTLLTDLEEMGFNDRDLNRKLLVQNAGSLKKTVKTLVTDTN